MKIIFRKGKFLKGTPNSNGYLRVFPVVNGKTLTRYVHRLVAEAFHGPCPPDMTECRHLNGARTENRPSNIEWSTKAINEHDKIAHGTLQIGDGHVSSILTEKLVSDARARVASGEKIQDVARDLRVNRTTLGDAICGKHWGHTGVPIARYSTRRKFRPEQVCKIRKMATAGHSQSSIAEMFGVHRNSIRQIVARESYQHVE